MANFEDSIDYVLAHGDGYADHPAGPGESTNYGISLRRIRAQGSKIEGDSDIDEFDGAKLKRARVSSLYREDLWDKNRLGEIGAQQIATKILDIFAHLGPKSGTKRLQTALNAIKASEKRLRVDGRVGSKTLAAIDAADPTELLTAIRNIQTDHYRYLIEMNDHLEAFLDLWLNRAAS